MHTQLEVILSQARATRVDTPAQLEALKAGLLGPNGSLTVLTRGLGQLPKEERPEAGQRINRTKEAVQQYLEACQERIASADLEVKLGAPISDPSLPAPTPFGGVHPLIKVRDEILSILASIGFVSVIGPEIDRAHFCFDALNTPKDHPARSPSDTYYFPSDTRIHGLFTEKDEPVALRPHTSSVQIRVMLERQAPLRVVSPGRCFRRDTADATHTSNFHQIEGLYVDKNVSVLDLKSTLDYLFRKLLGPKTQVRFRPHFFPFTEPSFEVDLKADHLGKVGQEWIEIMGCGMVDPQVLRAVDYDPETLSGFAFGMGVERIAMILYGVEDIRHFYTNDLRFLNQFS